MRFAVLTFNVFQLRFKGSRRRARIAQRVIEQASPNVIVLNEVFNRPARALVRRLRAAGYNATPVLGGFGGGWTAVSGRRRGWRRITGGGVCVLSRFPIEAQYQHIYRAVAPRTTEALDNKGAVLVAMRTAGERVWVVGTHLHADERGSRHAERMAQLAELRDFVATTVPPGEPVILAGDLNVAYYDDSQPSEGFRTACRVLGVPLATEPVHDFTFDGVANTLTRRTDPGYRNVLDYVCVLQSRRPLDVNTLTLRGATGHEASDHYPVLATVSDAPSAS